MALEALKERERGAAHRPRPFAQVIETVSGLNDAVTTLSVTDFMDMMSLVGLEWSSNATSGVLLGGLYYAGENEYDPNFVERVLRADAAPVEATFDNVVDMMDWLERD